MCKCKPTYLTQHISWKNKQEYDTINGKNKSIGKKLQQGFDNITLGQSFRICWGRSGQLLSVSANVNPITGTYIIAAHQLIIHSCIFRQISNNGEIRKRSDIEKQINGVLYDAQFQILYKSCIQKQVSGDTLIPTYYLDENEKISDLVTNIVRKLSLAQCNFSVSTLPDYFAPLLKPIYSHEMFIWCLFYTLYCNPCLCIVDIGYQGKIMNYFIDANNLSIAERETLRKHNFIKLLQKSIEIEEFEKRKNIKKEVMTNEKVLDEIIQYLYSGLIESAVEECFKENNLIVYKSLLGPLLAEFPNHSKSEKIKYHMMKCDTPFISEVHLKLKTIYNILTGKTKFSPNVDWKKALLFTAITNYDSKDMILIQDVFNHISDEILSQKSSFVYPNYRRELHLKSNAKIEIREEHSECLDLSFIMIGLYSKGGENYQLENLMDAKGYTNDYLEKRLLFLLYLCYINVIKYSKSISLKENPWISQFLISGILSELEMLGLWHWVIFVLLLMNEKLQLTDYFLRKGVQDIIARNIEEIINNDEDKKETKTSIARSKRIFIY